MRIAGIILIVLGALALAYGGFTYTRSEEVLDVGPISASVENRERVPISPIAGGIAIALGIGLMIAGSRKGS